MDMTAEIMVSRSQGVRECQSLENGVLIARFIGLGIGNRKKVRYWQASGKAPRHASLS